MPRAWDGTLLEPFDEHIPVLNSGNPEVVANRLLGEAFAICNGTLKIRPRRAHLCELLAYSQSYVEAGGGDRIELQALNRRVQLLAMQVAEAEANATAAMLAERTACLLGSMELAS
jgi:hypothetical protein